MSCSGKSNPNNGRRTMGDAVRTTSRPVARPHSSSPYGVPKVKVSFGAKSRGR